MCVCVCVFILPCVRGVEQYKDVREPKLESRIGMVGIKSVFRRATLRITNGDVSLESSIKHHIYCQLCFTFEIVFFFCNFPGAQEKKLGINNRKIQQRNRKKMCMRKCIHQANE